MSTTESDVDAEANETANRFPKYEMSPKVEMILSLLKECYRSPVANHSSFLFNDDADGDAETKKNFSDGVTICPRTFDGYACWDETPAGSTAFQTCPFFVTGFDPRRYAYKKCTENGTWFVHPEWEKEWSNYTTCVDMEDLDFRQLVNTIYVVGYALSVAALVLSLTVFVLFKTLHCTRTRIHVNLFMSFTVNNISWVIWYRQVVPDIVVIQENHIWCQVLHVALHYFMVANYMWMFCEGLHLHLALVVVFVKDEVAMKWFMTIGWIVPFLLIVIYASVRGSDPNDTIECWMNDSHTTWILTIPVLISLLASLVFLVNVVRVLLTKLHPNSARPAPLGLRKAVRAALILMPLFGLHHVLIPFRPDPGTNGEKAYQLVSAVIVSLQGFCVSCLFCFANQDVHVAIRTMFTKIFTNREAVITGAVTGESAALAHGRDGHATQTRDLLV